MSQHSTQKRLSIPELMQKKGREPIVVLTAYTARMAQLLDPHVDILLVGDSLGMVLYGFDSTLPVTLELMIPHGKAVASHSAKAAVVIDLPFGSYQESREAAFRNAALLLQQTGCQAVKLEGGKEMAETVAYLSERGIPVMAHVGLKPQYVHTHGGYRYQGRTEEEKKRIQDDALALQSAGAFAVLMECVEQEVARETSRILKVPTIGIGSGAGCDGQVVVTEDMLGLFDHQARFIKPYADIKDTITGAVKRYADEVRAGAFPDDVHSYSKKH